MQVKELSLKQQESDEKLVFSKRALQKEMTKVKKEQLNSFKTINEQETLINLKKVCRHSSLGLTLFLLDLVEDFTICLMQKRDHLILCKPGTISIPSDNAGTKKSLINVLFSLWLMLCTLITRF